IGDDVVRHAAQQNTVAAALPLHYAAAHRLPALAGADRRPGNLADPEELLVQLRSRDLVIQSIANAVDREQPLVRLGFLGNDSVIGPDDRSSWRPARGGRWRLRRGRGR